MPMRLRKCDMGAILNGKKRTNKIESQRVVATYLVCPVTHHYPNHICVVWYFVNEPPCLSATCNLIVKTVHCSSDGALLWFCRPVICLSCCSASLHPVCNSAATHRQEHRLHHHDLDEWMQSPDKQNVSYEKKPLFTIKICTRTQLQFEGSNYTPLKTHHPSSSATRFSLCSSVL